MPRSRAARTALAVSTSTTASWKLAATSATGTGSPPAAAPRPSGRRPSSGRRRRSRTGASRGPVSPRGKAIAAGSPSRATRSMCGPPGNGSPSSRATLSKASPAASSMVAPSGGHRRRRGRRRRSSASGRRRPAAPGTARAAGRARSVSTATCAARWLTPYSGLSSADRVGLGRGDADQQRAGQPGPGGDRDGVDVARSDPGRGQGAVHGRHHRLAGGPATATSGTTPPKRACSLDDWTRSRRRAAPRRRGRRGARCRRRSRRRTSRCPGRAAPGQLSSRFRSAWCSASAPLGW